MLQKQGFIFVLICGSIFHAVWGNKDNEDQSLDLDTALRQAPPDFLIAMKAIGTFLTNSINRPDTEVGATMNTIWDSFNRFLTNAVGSESFKKIVTHWRETLQTEQAHQSIVKIADTIHDLAVTDDKNSVPFPWKEFRQIIHSENVYAIPNLYSGLWDIALDNEKSEKLKLVITFFLDVLSGEVEDKITAHLTGAKSGSSNLQTRDISQLDTVGLTTSVVDSGSSISKIN